MNISSRLTPVLHLLLRNCRPLNNVSLERSFSSLTRSTSTPPCKETNSMTLLSTNQHCVKYDQNRGYKVKLHPKKRCAGCYFERRFGRLYVECTLKPRHKQMQKVFGMDFYKEDYSKGNWKRAAVWGFRENKIFYQLNNQYAKYDWLNGRIGKDV